MAPAKTPGLTAADPRVGQSLRFEGLEWEVTDHSSYWSDDGYRVTEWCCETDDVEAYLLKEVKEGEPIRWFFTRRIDRAGVAGLPPGRPATPPPTLTYEDRAYRYAETTEGTYEDEPGQRVPKTTWEYWDDGRQKNLAVELWGDGRVDCYHGAYIDPATVEPAAEPARDDAEQRDDALRQFVASRVAAVGAKGGAPRRRGNPFAPAAVLLVIVYAVAFFNGRPFDECLGVALVVAALVGWLATLGRAPRAAGLALLGMALGVYLFWTYPPLTSGIGLAMAIVAPLAVAWWARGEAPRAGRLPVVYAAASAVAVPALLVGLHRYFWYAPGPHTLAQLALALGPSALTGFGAMVLASVILVGSDTDTA